MHEATKPNGIMELVKGRLSLSRKQVAEILQTSPAWVTNVLRGDVNLIIESMAKLCHAVRLDVQIAVVPKRARRPGKVAVRSAGVANLF